MRKPIDWGLRGREIARSAWAAGNRSLTAIAHEPPLTTGPVDTADWHTYRGAYRGELHVLNLQQEIGAKS